MATGNAGMLTPYEQGVDHARRGYSWQQIYDQPGEEHEARAYRDGYFRTVDQMYKQMLKDNDTP
jgi:hypothetical protein